MMNANASLLLDVWEAVSESLPNTKREDMARKLVTIFAEYGMESDDFQEVKGEDDSLDNAIDARYLNDTDHKEFDYDEDYED